GRAHRRRARGGAVGQGGRALAGDAGLADRPRACVRLPGPQRPAGCDAGSAGPAVEVPGRDLPGGAHPLRPGAEGSVTAADAAPDLDRQIADVFALLGVLLVFVIAYLSAMFPLVEDAVRQPRPTVE